MGLLLIHELCKFCVCSRHKSLICCKYLNKLIFAFETVSKREQLNSWYSHCCWQSHAFCVSLSIKNKTLGEKGGRERRWWRSRCTGACISLHRCTRKTSSDAPALTEHQLRVDRSPCPLERNREIPFTQNPVRWRKEGEKERVSRTGPPSKGWGTEAGGRPPHQTNCFRQKGGMWGWRKSAAAGLWQRME